MTPSKIPVIVNARAGTETTECSAVRLRPLFENAGLDAEVMEVTGERIKR